VQNNLRSIATAAAASFFEQGGKDVKPNIDTLRKLVDLHGALVSFRATDATSTQKASTNQTVNASSYASANYASSSAGALRTDRTNGAAESYSHTGLPESASSAVGKSYRQQEGEDWSPGLSEMAAAIVSAKLLSRSDASAVGQTSSYGSSTSQQYRSMQELAHAISAQHSQTQQHQDNQRQQQLLQNQQQQQQNQRRQELLHQHQQLQQLQQKHPQRQQQDVPREHVTSRTLNPSFLSSSPAALLQKYVGHLSEGATSAVIHDDNVGQVERSTGNAARQQRTIDSDRLGSQLPSQQQLQQPPSVQRVSYAQHQQQKIDIEATLLSMSKGVNRTVLLLSESRDDVELEQAQNNDYGARPRGRVASFTAVRSVPSTGDGKQEKSVASRALVYQPTSGGAGNGNVQLMQQRSMSNVEPARAAWNGKSRPTWQSSVESAQQNRTSPSFDNQRPMTVGDSPPPGEEQTNWSKDNGGGQRAKEMNWSEDRVADSEMNWAGEGGSGESSRRIHHWSKEGGNVDGRRREGDADIVDANNSGLPATVRLLRNLRQSEDKVRHLLLNYVI